MVLRPTFDRNRAETRNLAQLALMFQDFVLLVYASPSFFENPSSFSQTLLLFLHHFDEQKSESLLFYTLPNKRFHNKIFLNLVRKTSWKTSHIEI